MSESGMHFLSSPQPNDRVVAVKVDGELTTEEMKTLIDRFQSIVDRDEKVLFFLDMQGYAGSELGALTEKFKHIGMLWKAVDKYAIVGETRWMEISVKIVDPLTPQQIKHFAPDRVNEAWAWLLAGETGEVN